jgi:hypothetical protein
MKWRQTALLCLMTVLPLPMLGGAQSVGCQLPDVAFCDSFDSGPGALSKSGDLDAARWHITRVNPAYQFAGNWSLSSYNEFPAVPVTPCRAGVRSVLAPSDAIVCDAASGHGGVCVPIRRSISQAVPGASCSTSMPRRAPRSCSTRI